MLQRTISSVRLKVFLLLLVPIAYLPQVAIADSKAPASVVALAPASVRLSINDWMLSGYDEFGTIASAQLHGSFPEFRTCAYAAGPEFALSLNVDTAWEASAEQLAMWKEMFLSELDFDGVPNRLVESIKVKISVAADTPVVATPVVEDWPNGHIAYVEFDWKCAGNPGGANTLLQGYALRGSTNLQFSFWIYAGRETAIVMASEILAAFETLDIAALIE